MLWFSFWIKIIIHKEASYSLIAIGKENVQQQSVISASLGIIINGRVTGCICDISLWYRQQLITIYLYIDQYIVILVFIEHN